MYLSEGYVYGSYGPHGFDILIRIDYGLDLDYGFNPSASTASNLKFL